MKEVKEACGASETAALRQDASIEEAFFGSLRMTGAGWSVVTWWGDVSHTCWVNCRNCWNRMEWCWVGSHCVEGLTACISFGWKVIVECGSGCEEWY